MVIKMAHSFKNADSNYFSGKFFCVNNCGYYMNINRKITVNCAHGRKDYQIIYVHQGEMIFEKENEKTVVPKGSFWLYQPNEPQHYSAKEIGSSYYWIHFSGTHAERILNDINLKSGMHTIGTSDGFAECIKQIVRIASESDNNLKVTGIALYALSLLKPVTRTKRQQWLERVIKKMEIDIENGVTKRDYAQFSGISKYYFIRQFREEIGMSPHAYFMHMRIEKSKLLLSETDMPVGEVALALHFNDSFYFSKLFKKETGLSPSAWRRAEISRSQC